MDPELIEDNDKYYETYSFVVNKLNSIIPNMQITDEIKKMFIIKHIYETLEIEDELLLLQYLLKNKDSLNENEQLLLGEYKKFIYDSKDSEDNLIQLYFTTNLKENKLVTMIYRITFLNGEFIINNATQNIRHEFGRDKITEIINFPKNKKLTKQLTYMSYKKGYFELKIKNTKEAKNKGASFEQKSPKNKMPILNEIIGRDIFIPKTKTIQGSNSKFSKIQWNIILEVLSKYYTLIGKNDEIYYLDKLYVATSL